MRQYLTSLKKRQAASRWHVNKYWADPDYRLKRVNRDRKHRGLEPYTDVSQIQPIGSWRRKQRDPNDQ